MLIFLKSLHLLCLLLGGASSIGNAVLMKRVAASGAAPPAYVADAMATLGKIGLAAIIVLWLTGLPLAWMTGAFAAGWPFWAKLVAATLILALVPGMMWLRIRASAGGPAVSPRTLRGMAAAVRLLTVAAIILAVIAFG